MTVWWAIVLYFVGSMGICLIGIFFLYKIYRSIKGVLFPVSQLPSHFKEVCTAQVTGHTGLTRTADWSGLLVLVSTLIECWDY